MSAIADQDVIRQALAQVEDPELHQPLIDLGMIGDIAVSGGEVTVRVLLTIAGCPLRQTLTADVTHAVGAIPGVTDVRVEFGVLADRARMALAQRLRANAPTSSVLAPAGPRVYAVASGKGGVGKSSVTANLAAALAAQGQRVGILDADVWGYSIPQLFGVHRSPVVLNGLMLPIESYGVALMSVGFLVADGQPVIWRGPMLHKALQQFFADVYWGDLDTLLIDLPPGTGDITISLLELCPQAQLLIVTTPQSAAHRVAARVGAMAREMGMIVGGVIENMSELVCGGCGASTALFGSGGGEQLARTLGAPLLGRIPLDLALREAGDAGRPVVLANPNGASAVELARVAGALPIVRTSLIRVPLPLAPA